MRDGRCERLLSRERFHGRPRTRERSWIGFFQALRGVANQQQRALFVARLAKNPLSERWRFGIMRVASQKNSGEVQESGRRKSREVP